jgi:hypothetical protein
MDERKIGQTHKGGGVKQQGQKQITNGINA